MNREHRYARRYEQKQDQRSAAQRDRDRILYSSAFRRLGGVTQVVAPTEGHTFHNRLTHSLKVAQIARRLAEHLIHENQATQIVAEGRIDPDIVEAAALAHDLGHPPFGHVAEAELDRLIRAEAPSFSEPDGASPVVRDSEGFEGNPQSFRVLTRLEAHTVGHGLNLTRSTLNAVLKYPWLHGSAPKGERSTKFGAYSSDRETFDFARDGSIEHERSIEAEIMDHADNMTYSVHDLEDFFRSGLIPVQLGLSSSLIDNVLDEWAQYLARQGNDYLLRLVKDADPKGLMRLLYDLFGEEPYRARYDQRSALRHGASVLIGRFLRAATLSEEDGKAVLRIDDTARLQMKFLQRIVWVNVISNPRISTQQEGQKRIIRELFGNYLSAIEQDRIEFLPPAFSEELADLQVFESASDEHRRGQVQLAADIVSSFTDAEALVMYRRMAGVAPGSISDLLHS